MYTPIRYYLLALIIALTCSIKSIAQKKLIINPARIIFAPTDTSLWQQWKTELNELRIEKRKQLNYSDSFYTSKNYQWSSRCYSMYMLMLFDNRFFDASTQTYKTEAFIKKGIKQYGGYDAVVLWHAYPRIGFDERNQFDFYRDFPSGLKGLKKLVAQFHQKGIKVFIDYNPWDKGTNREIQSDADMLALVIKETGADGIFLDTMNESASTFRSKLDSAKQGVVLESELELPEDKIYNHHMSWAQWYDDSEVPGVLWNKWFERRHILHLTKRWDRDHVSELQTAWMNGAGMMIWDNIFGSLNRWNERDKSIIRMMVPIQRKYHEAFTGEGWNPLFKVQLAEVYASEWYTEKYRLWTIINRSNEERKGPLFTIKQNKENKYFNLITGKETGIIKNDSVSFYVDIKPKGIASIIAINKNDITKDFRNFLFNQFINYSLYKDHTVKTAGTEKLIVPKPISYAKSNLPKGMVFIDKSTHVSTTRYTERECGFYDIPNKTGPAIADSNTIIQKSTVTLNAYATDETPVTNQQFYNFIKSSKYRPSNTENYLKHWINNRPPEGKEEYPVVYISLDDARAFAKWAGKRLPTEKEWQYAAEGPQQYSYPWGNAFVEEYCNNGQYAGTTPVKQFEKGRSAFGCYDMCGNIWQWTESERSDALTRFCIIKGGSYYKAKGSVWYTDGGAQPADFAAKFILSNEALNRCSTIGFRCAVDINR